MKRKIFRIYILSATSLLLTLVTACRNDNILPVTETIDTGNKVESNAIVGMYVLCEGNMGSNKCTVDFLDFADGKSSAIYQRNIYPERNPNAVKELGDVGNDIQIYGSRMWMVINCSNKVEVVDAATCRRIGQVEIPNCRYVVFDGRYAYVSSFAGPVQLGNTQLGYVCKVDTATLQVVAKVTVGYQPEEMAIVGGKLYVANSGGYLGEQGYDNTVSVVSLATFTEEGKIEVGVNPHRLRKDSRGQLWVTSRGNYNDIGYSVSWLAPDAGGNMVVGGTLPYTISDLCIVGDSLYFYGSAWSNVDQMSVTSYGIINVRTHQLVTNALSNSPELDDIVMPYGIIVNPEQRDFYVMDAKDFTSSGELFHFNRDGTFSWRVSTGDIPGHACFLRKR